MNGPSCSKSKTTSIDLFLTNTETETGISDYHKMICTYWKVIFTRRKINSCITDVLKTSTKYFSKKNYLKCYGKLEAHLKNFIILVPVVWTVLLSLLNEVPSSFLSFQVSQVLKCSSVLQVPKCLKRSQVPKCLSI